MRSVRVLTGVENQRAKIKAAAGRIIEYLLKWPAAKRIEPRKGWLAPPPLNTYKNLEPLGFGLDQRDWWIFPPEDCTPHVLWPIEAAVCADVGFGTEKGSSMTMTTLRSINRREARGSASRFSPYMARITQAQYFPEGVLSGAGVMAWIGGKWVDAERRIMWMPPGHGDEAVDVDRAIPYRVGEYDETFSRQGNLLTAIALRQRYEWAVSLGLQGTPSIRFATDPTGIKEIYRIRELPPGRDRREALLTWVTDHWRQTRHDPDVETYVRKHMRGAIKFEWWGMQCEVLPALYDLERALQFKEERQTMRLTGTDRRRRY